MIPIEFIKKYIPHARIVEAQTGMSAIAQLASSAVETGWGKTVVGNMMFGVKDTDGVNGNEQLLPTTEYLTTPNARFPAIYKITQVGKKLWKYYVADYFRKYNSPADSFMDYAKTIKIAPHWSAAWKVRHDYKLFFIELQKGPKKYATASNYDKLCIEVGDTISRLIKANNL
jgi:flagellar protein FlgJ